MGVTKTVRLLAAVSFLALAAATHAAEPAAVRDLRAEFDNLLRDECCFVVEPRPHRGFLDAALLGAEGGADVSDLAKKTQNPVSDLISLPLQYNATFGFGPEDKVLSVLNIQPVIPFKLSDDWNLITRTILPLINQPSLGPGIDSKFGLGDTTITAFLSPREPGEWIWGVGPVLLIPTSSSDRLGAGQWGAGVSGLVLKMDGPWVYGVLVNNVWSFEGDVNTFLLQYFVNYNLSDGWYINTAPILTANWKADSDNTWTVPFGIGAGRVFKAGKLPLNAQVGFYYNVEAPDGAGDWTLRLQLQFLFPQ
jgi:hypothetical protein